MFAAPEISPSMCHTSDTMKRKQGIHPGTFYNWVSKLRKAGYTIPDSESKSCALPVTQEVVKLDLTEHEIPAPAMAGQNTNLPSPAAVSAIAAEMECGNQSNCCHVMGLTSERFLGQRYFPRTTSSLLYKRTYPLRFRIRKVNPVLYLSRRKSSSLI